MHMNKLEDFINQSNTNDYFSSRFWAIEHTILMFFAIIFGHLGLVYAKKSKKIQKLDLKEFSIFRIVFYSYSNISFNEYSKQCIIETIFY